MQRILLTGASGFVGRQILEELSHVDAEIICLTHRNDIVGTLPNHVKIIQGSITDSEFLYEATVGIDIIIHAAAVISFKKKKKNKMFQVNVDAVRYLINAALENKVKKFIHISSIAAIGATNGNYLLDEIFSYNLKPLRVNYSLTKYLGEQDVLRGQAEGLQTIILNPSNIIGPNDYRYSNLAYVRMSQSNIKPIIKGGIGIVDVRDVAQAVVKCLTMAGSGQRYILSAKNVSYQEFLELIGKSKKGFFLINKWIAKLFAYGFEVLESLTTIKAPISIEKARLIGYYFWSDSTQSKNELGITYTLPKKTIDDMLAWYRLQGKIK